jgi:hypothetical protein
MPSQGQIPFGDDSANGQGQGNDQGHGRGNDRSGLYMGLLWLYVALLAVGTIGELLDIQWILDLPIY